MERPEAKTPRVRLIFHIREHEQLSCGPRQPRQESEDTSGTRGLLSRSALQPQSNKEDRCGAVRRIFPYDGKSTQEPRVVTKRRASSIFGAKMKRMTGRQFAARARSLPTRTILTPLTRQSRTLDTTPPNMPATPFRTRHTNTSSGAMAAPLDMKPVFKTRGKRQNRFAALGGPYGLPRPSQRGTLRSPPPDPQACQPSGRTAHSGLSGLER